MENVKPTILVSKQIQRCNAREGQLSGLDIKCLPVLLLGPVAFESREFLACDGKEADASIQIFRIAPLNFVAKVPIGKKLDETSMPMVDKAGLLSKQNILSTL